MDGRRGEGRRGVEWMGEGEKGGESRMDGRRGEGRRVEGSTTDA